ncbi:MAG: type II secretion system protein, partial [Rivularia sp. (in: cyanobacteria)]
MFNKHWNNSSSSGFTLLEMLVVIAVVGLLTAIAAPSWVAFVNTRRLNSA